MRKNPKHPRHAPSDIGQRRCLPIYGFNLAPKHLNLKSEPIAIRAASTSLGNGSARSATRFLALEAVVRCEGQDLGHKPRTQFFAF